MSSEERKRLLQEARKRGVPDIEAMMSAYDARKAMEANTARQTRLAQLIAQEQQAQGASPMRRAAGSVVAGGMHLADTATFGTLPQIAGALGGDSQKVEDALAISERTNPGAAAVGDFSAFFTPGSAARMATQGGAKLASRGLASIAAKQAGSGYMRRAGSQIGAALLSSAGGIGAMQAGEVVGDVAGGMDATAAVEEAFATTREQFSSPLNLGLAIGIGSVAGAFRSVPTQEGMRIKKIAQKLGINPTPDMVRAGAEGGDVASKAMSRFGRMPGFEGVRSRFLRGVTGALDRNIARIRSDSAGSKDVAARAVREITGGAKPGRITQARKAQQRRAFAAEGKNEIGEGSQNAIERVANDFVKTSVERGENLSPQMGAWFKRYNKALKVATKKGKTLQIGTVENLRQQLKEVGKIAKNNPDLLSEADSRLAKQLLGTIDEIYQSKAGLVHRTQRAAKALHTTQAQMGKVSPRVVKDASATLDELFAAKNFQRRWDAIEEYASPEELSALKGVYFARMVEKSSSYMDEGRTIGKAALSKAMGSSGPFEREKATRILGREVLDELDDMATISDSVKRGLGKHAGSDTQVNLTMAGLLAGASSSLLTMYLAVNNPVMATKLFLTGLGTVGTKVAINSVITGKSRDALNKLASGQPVAGLGRGAAAIQGVGVDELSGVVKESTGLATAGASGLKGVQELIRGQQENRQ
jgi:hypothetical protein